MEISSDIRFPVDTSQPVSQPEVKVDSETPKITTDTPSPAVKTDSGIEIPPALLNMDRLSQVLISAGLKPTDTNLKMLQAMLSSGFPADKENLMKMNQAFKLAGQSIEKALFFMETEIRMSPKNAEAVDNYSKNNIKILNQLEAVFKEIEALPEGELKNSLREIFQPEILTKTPQSMDKTLQNPPDLKPLSDITPETATQKPMENIPKGENPIIKSDMITEALQNITKALETKNNNDLPALLKDVTSKIAEALGKEIQNLTEPEIIEFLDKLPIEGKVKEEILKEIKNTIKENVTSDILGDKTQKKEFEPEIRQHVETGKETESQPVKGKVMKKFALDIANGGKEEIGKTLSSLKEAVEQAKDMITKSNANPEKLMQTIKNVSDNIEFMTQIKNSVYVQIPILINNEKTNAEIFVFSNKKAKKNAQSALISLDLARLKHLEVYLHKAENQLTCQFRVSEDWVEDLIRGALSNLSDLLSSKNLSLCAVSYKRVDEPFTIIDKEPGITDSKEPEFFCDLKI